jgi:hypothetical protein
VISSRVSPSINLFSHDLRLRLIDKKGRIKSTFDLRELSLLITSSTPSSPSIASASLFATTSLLSSSTATLYKSRSRIEPTNLNLSQYNYLLWNRIETLVKDLGECCIKVYNLEKVLRFKKDGNSGETFLDEVLKVSF